MRIIALDVGEKRIGVAYADSNVRIALPRKMIPVDGGELENILKAYEAERADVIISGLPRNNSGEATRQTEAVQNFIIALKAFFVKQKQFEPEVVFQDESWTSEEAKDHLAQKKHQITRSDRDSGVIDSEAATVILQDFLESPRMYQIETKIKHRQS